MDVNEHERLSNFTQRQIKERNSTFNTVLYTCRYFTVTVGSSIMSIIHTPGPQ